MEKEVREEKKAVAKSLGDALKENRIRCRMTQEIVAETPGGSRQSVSKWENGSGDPTLHHPQLNNESRFINCRAEKGIVPPDRIWRDDVFIVEIAESFSSPLHICDSLIFLKTPIIISIVT